MVRLPENQAPETLSAHFRYLQKVFRERFGIKLDASKGGNPTDLRFVSYDAEPYLNENATVMKGMYTPPKPSRISSGSQKKPVDNSELVSHLVHYTQNAAEGQRHETLLKAAILAGGYLAAGRIDEQTAVYALETVASEWPNFSKSQKTIRDGIRYGLAKPIDEPPNPAYSPVIKPQPNNITKTTAFRDSVPEIIITEKDAPYRPANSGTQGKPINFFEWQRVKPPFNQLGLASLKNTDNENSNKNDE